ncbi:MAG: hypothetical protein ABS882_03555 [Lysinibacillus sp.]
MSAFNCKRTYKQLMAERNALSYFISQRKAAKCACKLSDEQRAELESDEALLKRINEDIERARSVIGNELPTRLEGSD